MNATVLAAIITGAATLIAGLIAGALAGYFARRRHNQTIAQTARAKAQDREDEAQRREEELRRQAETAHRREAVAYLKLISTTISRMRERLADERLPDEARIPHKDGKILLGLLEGYKEYLQQYLDEKTLDELGEQMRRVDEKASMLDGRLYSGDKPEPELLSDVVADMQRVEGRVEVQAARISPTESRAN